MNYTLTNIQRTNKIRLKCLQYLVVTKPNKYSMVREEHEYSLSLRFFKKDTLNHPMLGKLEKWTEFTAISLLKNNNFPWKWLK